ncbi:MAG: prefoldin subunit alpha [Methanomassiliicoccales archaeon]|nr:MAG: prefoldin subunit alpha [Methanomassiliicoccales archaeon]
MDETELQESIRTLEFYRAQMENYDQQFGFLGAQVKEHNSAKETMTGYKELKEGSITLIPIGAGSFLFAKVADPNKAMVGMGANVVIETDMDDATAKLDDRIKEIEEGMKSLSEKYQEIADKAAELTAKIQNAYEGK